MLKHCAASALQALLLLAVVALLPALSGFGDASGGQEGNLLFNRLQKIRL